MLYRCLRLPKTKIKYASLFEQQSSPDRWLCCTIYKTANVPRASFCTETSFIFYFCAVMPQRSKAVICVTCIVHDLAMTLRIFFCLDAPFQPATNKELGSNFRSMYSLVIVLLQPIVQCMRCILSISLSITVFIAIEDTLSWQWRGTWWSMHVKYFYYRLMVILAWRSTKTLCRVLFSFLLGVRFVWFL